MSKYEKTNAVVLGTQIGNIFSSSGTASFRPVILYQFEVNGQTFTGDKYYQQALGTKNRRAIQKVLDRYPQGSAVEIYYNVKRPSDSFINKGRPPEQAIVLTIVLLVLSIILLGLVLVFFAPDLLVRILQIFASG